MDWQQVIVFLQGSGELFITVLYFSIPIASIYTVLKRTDLQFDRSFFVFICLFWLIGTVHLFVMANIWFNFEYFEKLLRFIAGLLALCITYTIWKAVPTVIKIPSQSNLRKTIKYLQDAEDELILAKVRLEEEVAMRTAELERLTRTDPLTGVTNRRGLTTLLDNEIARFNRYRHPFCVLMIDLDDFKQINDRYGHKSGDDVLVTTAHLLIRLSRTTDTVARVGGEEFLVLMPDTQIQPAHRLAERIREGIEDSIVATEEGHFRFTCSIGIAEMQETYDSTKIYGMADNALYEAKKAGKNCVMDYSRTA